ncbi:hypothetical protein EYF80_061690 [Liparis tanakae]|uniref:Uncharacterized protein n=1 Tax=Liparis tanakae TaxID=230148 RepID=A0A4Z2EII6_9TELE|nr:hypothetical protein EYF80_061690 [Liparis tanakae]
MLLASPQVRPPLHQRPRRERQGPSEETGACPRGACPRGTRSLQRGKPLRYRRRGEFKYPGNNACVQFNDVPQVKRVFLCI